METRIPPPPPGYQPAAARPGATNTLAVVSLVAGIAGYVIPHPFVAGLIAIVTGHMARGQIRQTGESGAGLALAGLILGYVHLALSILLILLIVWLIVVAGGIAIFGATHRG